MARCYGPRTLEREPARGVGYNWAMMTMKQPNGRLEEPTGLTLDRQFVASGEPRVVISLLVWNNGDDLLVVLDRLLSIDYTNFSIVVVDNGSADDTALARATVDDASLQVIRAGENLGYAGGNALAANAALEAGADLLWIVNPDAVVRDNTLRELVNAYQNHGPALYGSAPVHRVSGRERVLLRTWALGANGQPVFGRRMTIDCDYGDLGNRLPYPVATLHGSSLLIPTSVIRQHGFIDTRFFLYSEESDYSFRLWREGVPSYLVPASVVEHAPAGAHKHDQRLKPVITYYQTRNRLILAQRYGLPLDYAKIVARQLANVVGWTALASIRGVSALQTARMTLAGIVDAARGRLGKTYAPEAMLALPSSSKNPRA